MTNPKHYKTIQQACGDAGFDLRAIRDANRAIIEWEVHELEDGALLGLLGRDTPHDWESDDSEGRGYIATTLDCARLGDTHPTLLKGCEALRAARRAPAPAGGRARVGKR